MPQDINKALEDLEKNLKDLESARVQVEKTINASNDLQRTVSKYVFSVKSLCESLGQMVITWDTRTQAILDNFEKRVQSLTKEFSEKTDKEVKLFEDQNIKLSSSVKELSRITSNLSGIKSLLEEKLDVLKDAISFLRIEVEEYYKSINENIDYSRRDLWDSVTTLHKKTDTIQSRLSEIEKSLVSSSARTNKNSLISIFAIIVGIVVLATLHFI